MRLRLIVPVAREDAVARFDRESPLVASPGTSIEVVGLESGPSSIETRVDEVAAGPGILRRVREADADGVDGIYICCLADPAVDAARELTTIPVVGAFEAAVLTALLVGRQVTVLTVVESATRLLWDLTRHHALQDRVRAIRAIDVPVEQLHGPSPTVDRLAAAATRAVRSGRPTSSCWAAPEWWTRRPRSGTGWPPPAWTSPSSSRPQPRCTGSRVPPDWACVDIPQTPRRPCGA